MTDSNAQQITGETSTASPATSIPKVMGILLIIFSSIYLFTSLISAVSMLLGSAFMDLLTGIGPMMTKKGGLGPGLVSAMEEMKTIYRVQGIEKLVTAGLSGLGLAAGVGLMRYTARGLKLSFWWAVAALAYLAADFTVYAAYIMPATARFMEAVTSGMASAMGTGTVSTGFFSGAAGYMGIAGMLIVNGIMAAMPVLTIVFMTRENVKRACGAERIM